MKPADYVEWPDYLKDWRINLPHLDVCDPAEEYVPEFLYDKSAIDCTRIHAVHIPTRKMALR